VKFVQVTNSDESLALFNACRELGFRHAADAIQNSGDILLTDIQQAMATITHDGLYQQYRDYVNRHTVQGPEVEVTTEQKYLADPSVCPYCGSDITAGEMTGDGVCQHQETYCDNCDARFMETYRLDRVAITQEGRKPYDT
jgi:hypothetical protein